MNIAISAVLIIVTLIFIGSPFIWKRGNDMAKRFDFQAEQAHIDSLLRELEFDLELGNISEEDYRQLKRHLLEKTSSPASAGQVPQKIQAEDDAIEAEVLKLRRSKGLLCPECGAKYKQSDRFCPQCGIGITGNRNKS